MEMETPPVESVENSNGCEYDFRPLSGRRTFRVLRIHGSIYPEETVVCDMLEMSLDDAQLCYEAISYCWGGQRPTELIMCEGERILVTKNAEMALRRYRPRLYGHSRLLWM